MKIKLNNIITGILAGCLAPPLAFIIFCFIVYPDNSCWEILKGYYKGNFLTHIISLSVIINLPLFFIFLNSNNDRAARGVIGATLLFAFLILALKLN